MPKNRVRFEEILAVVERHRFLVFTIIFSLFPLFWFHPWSTLITGGDFWLPLSPLNSLGTLSHSWLSNVSGGQPNSIVYHLFPWISFWSFFRFLTLSLSDIEKLWFLSAFLVGSVSMFYLVSEIFGRKEEGWPNFVAAVFYLYNLYIMITGVVTTTFLSYLLLPLFFLIYVKGCRSKGNFKLAVGLALVTVFFTSAAANPPIYLIPFVLAFFYCLYQQLFRRRQHFSWRFNLAFLIFYLLFNAWWLFLFVKGLFSQLDLVKQITAAATVGAYSNFSDLIRLLGSWAFFAGHMGFPYFPFAQSYLNPILMFLTFVIPFLALAGLILTPRKFDLKFFALVSILGIFLSHGSGADLLGKVYIFIKSLIPFLWVYREPFAKFASLTTFGYALLIAGFLVFVRSRLKNTLLVDGVGLLVTVLILVVAWPVVLGEHYPPRRGVLAPSRTEVPLYWFDLADWFRGKREAGRVLVLPDNPDWNRSGIPYAWGYDSADVGPHLLPVDWIERNNGYFGLPVLSDQLSRVVFRVVDEGYPYPQNLTSGLGFFNVSRVLQRNDVDLIRVGETAANYSPEHIKSVLAKQPGLSLEKSIGALDVYQVSPSLVWPKFYRPQDIVCLSGDFDRLDLSLNQAGQNLYSMLVAYRDLKRAGLSEWCNRLLLLPAELFYEGNGLKSAPVSLDFTGNLRQKLEIPSPGVVAQSDQRLYGFEVPHAGIYQLQYFADPQTQKVKNLFKLKLELWQDDHFQSLLEATLGPDDQSRVNFGQIVLKAGRYLLTLAHPSFTNLVENGSFELGPWRSSLKALPLSLSDDALFGSRSLDFGPQALDAETTFVQVRPASVYEFSLYYKVNFGLTPTVLIWENPCEGAQPIWKKYTLDADNTCVSNFIIAGKLENQPNWTRFTYDYRPSKTAKKTGVALAYLDVDGRIISGNGQTLIDRVMLRPKSLGGLALEQDLKPPLSREPQPKVEKSSVTDYQLTLNNLSGLMPLVFSETFSPDWRLSWSEVLPNQNPALNSKHFLVNGYANAWFINPPAGAKLDVAYGPEGWFRLFLGLSLLGILVSLFYLKWGRSSVNQN